jgi:hypothetical protein
MDHIPTHARIVLVPVTAVVVTLSLVLAACSDDQGDGDPGPDASPQPLGEVDAPGPERPANETDDRLPAAGGPSCSASESISWNAAVDHVGSQVTVIGPVYEVGDASGDQLTVTMGSSEVEPSRRLDVLLTANALNDIEGDARELFEGEEVCVFGDIESVDGNHQIVVNESEDLTRL